MIAESFSTTALWNMGTPIKTARFDLAPRDLISRLTESPRVQINQAFEMLKLLQCPKSVPAADWHKSVMADFEVKTAANRRIDAIQLEIDQNFMRLVRSKEVRCFGFELPRTVASVPVELLPEYWNYFPNWDEGTYKHDGLNLINLRVIASAKLPAPSQQAERTKVGRPSIRPEIIAAINALQSNGSYNYTRVSANFTTIRTWIRKHRPNSRAANEGFGDDVIRKAIKEHAENSIKEGMEIL